MLTDLHQISVPRMLQQTSWDKFREDGATQVPDPITGKSDLRQRQGKYSVEDLLAIVEVIRTAKDEEIGILPLTLSARQWEYLRALGRGLRRAKFLEGNVNPVMGTLHMPGSGVYFLQKPFNEMAGTEQVIRYSLAWALSYIYGLLSLMQEVMENDLLYRYSGNNASTILLHAAAFTGPLQGWWERDPEEIFEEVDSATAAFTGYMYQSGISLLGSNYIYANDKHNRLKLTYPLLKVLEETDPIMRINNRIWNATYGYILALLAWYEPYINMGTDRREDQPAEPVRAYRFLNCSAFPDDYFVICEARNRPGKLPDRVLCLVLDRHSNAMLPCYTARTEFDMDCLLIPASGKVLDIMAGIYGLPKRDRLLQESMATQFMLGVGAEDYALTVLEHEIGGERPFTYDRLVDIRDFINNASALSDTDNTPPENIFHMVYVNNINGISLTEITDECPDKYQ